MHLDWSTLARHLVADLRDLSSGPVVTSGTVVAELQEAQHAASLFRLELVDALDCAEIIVRHRILVATGARPRPSPSPSPQVVTPETRVA